MEKRKALPEYCTSAYTSRQTLLKCITTADIVHENAHGATVPKAGVQGWRDGRADKGKEGIERGRGRGKERDRERGRERKRKKRQELKKRRHALCLVMYGDILLVSGSPATGT